MLVGMLTSYTNEFFSFFPHKSLRMNTSTRSKLCIAVSFKSYLYIMVLNICRWSHIVKWKLDATKNVVRFIPIPKVEKAIQKQITIVIF